MRWLLVVVLALTAAGCADSWITGDDSAASEQTDYWEGVNSQPPEVDECEIHPERCEEAYP